MDYASLYAWFNSHTSSAHGLSLVYTQGQPSGVNITLLLVLLKSVTYGMFGNVTDGKNLLNFSIKMTPRVLPFKQYEISSHAPHK